MHYRISAGSGGGYSADVAYCASDRKSAQQSVAFEVERDTEDYDFETIHYDSCRPSCKREHRTMIQHGRVRDLYVTIDDRSKMYDLGRYVEAVACEVDCPCFGPTSPDECQCEC